MYNQVMGLREQAMAVLLIIARGVVYALLCEYYMKFSLSQLTFSS